MLNMVGRLYFYKREEDSRHSAKTVSARKEQVPDDGACVLSLDDLL